jgi:hypothetical protein
MKSVLHRYTGEEEIAFWKQAIFVFDSSALLNFYEYSASARSGIYTSIFPLLQNRLWITSQTEYEFLQNRERVMRSPNVLYKKLQEENYPNRHFKSFLNQYTELRNKTLKDTRHPFMPVAFFKSLDETLKRVQEEIDELEEIMVAESKRRLQEHEEQLKEDRLLEYFQMTKGFTFSEQMELAKEGEFRYRQMIPPGYKDNNNDDKRGLRKFGDLIIWKQMLLLAREVKKPIILILDDLKEDWCYKDPHDKTRIDAPREELLKEMQDVGGVPFWAYSLSQFIFKSQEILDARIEGEVIAEVKEVSEQREESLLPAVLQWAQKKFPTGHFFQGSEFKAPYTGADLIVEVDGVQTAIHIERYIGRIRPKYMDELADQINDAQDTLYPFGAHIVVMVADSAHSATQLQSMIRLYLPDRNAVAGFIDEKGEFVEVT